MGEYGNNWSYYPAYRDELDVFVIDADFTRDQQYIPYGTGNIFHYIMWPDSGWQPHIAYFIVYDESDNTVYFAYSTDTDDLTVGINHDIAWDGKGSQGTYEDLYLPPGNYTAAFYAYKADTHIEKFVSFTIYKVTNVEWENYYENPVLGNDSEGKTIFPDKHDPNDESTQRNRVRVKATITPQITNLPVYFSWWDVDDPCGNEIDTKPEGHPNTGPDNYGTGAVLTSGHEVTDGSGFARKDFYVSKQPGDNFRIAASASQNQLNNVTYNNIDSNNQNNWPIGVYFSPTLTVWRHLWIEQDSMGPVVAPVPADSNISQNFSSGKPGTPTWTYYSNNEGRIDVVNGRLRMDDYGDNWSYSLNNTYMHFNYTGKFSATLTLDHWNINDENESIPATFTGLYNGDGISVSVDGTHWVRVTNLTGSFTAQAFDLTSAIIQAKTAAGSEDVNDVQIKFQQYDNSCYSYDGREFDNIILNLHSLTSQPEQNCVIGTEATYSAYDPNNDETTVYLHRDLPDEFEDLNQFKYGRYIAGGNTYTVISSEDRGGIHWDNDIVVVAGNATNAGSSYILYDDDDQNIFNTPHYCSLGNYANAFRAAKIEPVELSTYHTIVAFDRNITGSEIDDGTGNWDSGQDVATSSDFWACTVVTCYQGNTSEDMDNEASGACFGAVDDDTNPNINIAVIFIETISDYFFPQMQNIEGLFMAHEIGHIGGGKHGDGGYNDIMGNESGESSPSATSFADKTIKSFRSNSIWSTSN
jgi:hypothetical protein